MADVKEILGLKGTAAKGPGKKPKKLNPANTPDKDKPKKSSKRQTQRIGCVLNQYCNTTLRLNRKKIEFLFVLKTLRHLTPQ